MGFIGGIHHGSTRALKEASIDKADFVYRLLTNRMDLPPYTLRQFVGGSKGYREVGPWFVGEFGRLDLLKPGMRILDIGCGCGRLASAFARDAKVREMAINYTGMDVDQKSIDWCQKNITPRNPRFSFYQVDMRSRTYNPHGKEEAHRYRFPHPDGSFDLFILTSVFTHLVEADATQFMRELARMAAPGATIYASFFVYKTEAEAVQGVPRRANKFPGYDGDVAVADREVPENAIAFREDYLIGLLNKNGLYLKSDIIYGLQDVFLLTNRKPA